MAARSPRGSEQEDHNRDDSFNSAIDTIIDWPQGSPESEDRRVIVGFPYQSRYIWRPVLPLVSTF